MSRILVVYLKEITDSLRDRRTALMVFFASILAGPLTLILVAQYVAGLEEKASILRVRMVGEEYAAPLVNFLRRSDVEITKAPQDYEARIKEGRLDAVIVVRPDFYQHFLAGDGAAVDLVYDDSRTESLPAVRQAERLLRAFNRETGTLRLVARGVSPDLLEPVKVEHVNTSTPRQRGAFLMFLIPMFAILSPLLGGMTIAIDATAGERERGSLEPLLANPVPTLHLVIGKWLAAWTTGASVALITLLGFVVAASLYSSSKVAAMLQFGWREFLVFAAFAIPFAALTSSVQMLIATYGRSYREAQTYTTYIGTAASFVPMIVIFSGLKDAFWQAFVPVLGQQMALTRVLRGEALGWVEWLVPAAVAFLLVAVCVRSISKLLAEERIVFGRS
ncbi:ABC transporter permease [Usitatibacter palustris]|uniref:ABC transporter permease protein NatB n=1 Tax=Usitatibacter palustris TaxID=2732487 RepID=A0A6M4H658_9PROT|nr:ABC transporter permease [Usitatibacter palustris]QJR14990.1 ABC transporter permease protein NatB [Usitatibacter palustris]